MAARTQTQSSASGAVASATASTLQGTGLGSWVGYHVAITSGTGVGQVRYAYTSAGRTDVLRLSRNWDIVPTTSSDFHVAWNQDDYDGDFGNDFKLVLKAAAEWDVGADSVTMGAGTYPVVGGTVEQAFSQDEYWDILNNGYFAMGYLFGSPPDNASLGGWYWNSNNANTTLGFQYIRVQPGGTLALDGVNCGTVFAHSILCRSSSNCSFYDTSFTNLMYNGARLKGYTTGSNLSFQGTGISNDYVVLASGFEQFSGPITLANSYGFESSAEDETVRVTGYRSVNALQDVEAHNSTTWEFINPEWDTPTILWTQNDAQSVVSEIFTLDAEVRDTEGSALASAAFVVVQGSIPSSATTPNIVVADASGIVSTEVLKRHFVSTSQTDTYGNFFARAWKWGYSPFGTILAVDGAMDVPIAMPLDSELTSETEASALLYNDLVLYNHASAGSSGKLDAMTYASGQAAWTVSAVTSGATSGAHGFVREFIGDTGDGTVVLVNRSGGEFTSGEALYQSGTLKAYASTNDFYEKYTYEINCKNRALWQVYDHAMARLATQSAVVDEPVEWSRERHTHMVEAAGGNYFTQAIASTGIWMSARGTGTVNYMAADSGTQYIPPVQYSFTLTGLQSDSEVRLLDADNDNAVITGIEDSGTSFNYNYTYGGSDTNIIVVVFHLNYLAVRLTGLSLSNQNQSIPVQQTIDRVYANP